MKIKKVLTIAILVLFLLPCLHLLFFFGTLNNSHPTGFYENATTIDVAQSADYNNCILLQKDKAVQVIDQVTTTISYNNLEQTLNAQIENLKDKEIRIIFTAETDFRNLTDMLKIITKLKVTRYKLLKA